MFAEMKEYYQSLYSISISIIFHSLTKLTVLMPDSQALEFEFVDSFVVLSSPLSYSLFPVPLTVPMFCDFSNKNKTTLGLKSHVMNAISTSAIALGELLLVPNMNLSALLLSIRKYLDGILTLDAMSAYLKSTHNDHKQDRVHCQIMAVIEGDRLAFVARPHGSFAAQLLAAKANAVQIQKEFELIGKQLFVQCDKIPCPIKNSLAWIKLCFHLGHLSPTLLHDLSSLLRIEAANSKAEGAVSCEMLFQIPEHLVAQYPHIPRAGLPCLTVDMDTSIINLVVRWRSNNSSNSTTKTRAL